MRALFDLIAPPRCWCCQVPSPPPWCRPCTVRAARHRIDRRCDRCGGPSTAAAHGCWAADAPVTSTIAVFHYRELIAETIVTAKVRGASAAWEPLGALLGDAVTLEPPELDAVTFVPTEPGRRRRRGFDHAHLLARGVSRVLAMPAVTLLSARRGAPDQGGRGLSVRGCLPADTFVATRPLDGARLLLVDDVLTTGATAAVAARALRLVGAEAVHLAVLARAGRHQLVRVDPGPLALPGT